MRKAVSALIAVVILVAVTIAIAVFLAVWVGGLARTQTEGITSAAQLGCQYVYLDTDSHELRNASGNWSISFRVVSTSSGNTTIRDVRIVYSNGSYTTADRNSTFLPRTIIGGDAHPILITNTTAGAVSPNISFVKLLTDCPDANVEIQSSEFSIVQVP